MLLVRRSLAKVLIDMDSGEHVNDPNVACALLSRSPTLSFLDLQHQTARVSFLPALCSYFKARAFRLEPGNASDGFGGLIVTDGEMVRRKKRRTWFNQAQGACSVVVT